MKRAVSHRNQSIDFQSKSMDWFLYETSAMKELTDLRKKDFSYIGWPLGKSYRSYKS